MPLNTGLPVETYDDEEIKVLTEQMFSHVYRVYPRLPSPVCGLIPFGVQRSSFLLNHVAFHKC